LQDLVAEVPAAKELFDKAADILGYDLLKVWPTNSMGDSLPFLIA